ncbi:MAG: SgcJ/EcaC family oxidoreductase [Acidobacteriota bacterium]
MDDKARIAEIEHRIMAAFAAGDAEALVAQYTEDAVLLSPDYPAIQGRAAILEAYRAALDEYEMRLETVVEETEVAGDWAWMRGRFEHTSTRKADGAATTARGKYLVIARRDPDGAWRFHRDAFNLDEPRT